MIDLRLGDCLDVMRGIPDASIDAVITDPPYNVGKNYGIYKDNRTPEEYRAWMQDVVSEARRVAKSIAFFVSGRLTKLYFDLMPDAHLVVVHKRAAGMIQDNYAHQYHAILAIGRPAVKIADLWNDIRLPGEGYLFREERFDHPGLTGLELTCRMIESYSQEGDTILDPFAGSGTTLVAALKLGRNAIGIELNPEYVSIAQRRIQEAQAQLTMSMVTV